MPAFDNPNASRSLSAYASHTTRVYQVPEGMPLSVFNNKYSRRKANGDMQSYAERISEVITGNFLLDPRWRNNDGETQPSLFTDKGLAAEYQRTLELAVAGVIPTSGRHLQNGDHEQPNKIMELFTNCSTAMFSFMLFRLLLRGSGVGRDYSSACCRVDWNNMPNLRLVLDETHPDFNAVEFNGYFDAKRDAQHKYDSDSEMVRWFTVEDSREGWVKCVEILETAAWQGKHRDKLFIFDFSQVRPAGAPIMGLQGRPASGPLALMRALAKIASIKGTDMKPWRQALFIDHYLAACVQMGGVRRSARMSVKHWRDRDVIEFVDIKRGGFLWSSNNSILVDEDFWDKARSPKPSHARRVFEAIAAASYFDATGEPGFINVDKMNNNKDGMDRISRDNYINLANYPDLHPRTQDMIENVLGHVMQLKNPFLTNPCGEIVLATYGGYCLIGDVCLAHAHSKAEAIDAVQLLAKFLVRVNLMRADYSAEVKRTNRIGVGLTGIHEFAWTHFGLTFRDMISYHAHAFKPANVHDGYIFDPKMRDKARRVQDFWLFIDSLRRHTERAADEISRELNLTPPHTVTTIKPSGTISKVMACTEGCHLPALKHYLRWVQYHVNDPDLAELKSRGYPTRDISAKYPDHHIVGFPTKQPIVDLMGAENVITADETSPAENYQWLQLLERFWLGGERGNQVSYTLKYDPQQTDFTDYMQLILDHQPHTKVCSVLPQSDWQESARIFGYVPEQPITEAEYQEFMSFITNRVAFESYDDEALKCEGGACPIEFDNPTNLRKISTETRITVAE